MTGTRFHLTGLCSLMKNQRGPGNLWADVKCGGPSVPSPTQNAKGTEEFRDACSFGQNKMSGELVGRKCIAGMRQPKLFSLILSALFFLSFPKAWGADWKYLGETPTASYYYDVEDMVRQENVVRVWVKAVYSPEGRRMEAEKVGGDVGNVTDSTALEEIDCKDKNHRAVALVVYSMEGKVVISDFRERGLDFMLPDSIFKSFYRRVCK
jgi:hypothetical protein